MNDMTRVNEKGAIPSDAQPAKGFASAQQQQHCNTPEGQKLDQIKRGQQQEGQSLQL